MNVGQNAQLTPSVLPTSRVFKTNAPVHVRECVAAMPHVRYKNISQYVPVTRVTQEIHFISVDQKLHVRTLLRTCVYKLILTKSIKFCSPATNLNYGYQSMRSIAMWIQCRMSTKKSCRSMSMYTRVFWGPICRMPSRMCGPLRLSI